MPADPTKLKVKREINRPDILFCLARAANSSRIFAGSSDGKVYEFDLAEDKPKPKELSGHTSFVTGLALSGQGLVSGSYDGRLIWWDLETRQAIRSLPAHSKWIRGVEASPDGATIASVADDMVARLWNAADGEQLLELQGHEAETPHHYPSMLYACAFSPDGKYLATGDRVGHVAIWEAATGQQVASLEAPVMYTWDPVQRRHSIGGIRSLAFSPDGRLLAVGGMGKVGNIDHLEGPARVEVFDWQKNQRTHEFASDKFKGLVERLVFHPSGPWLFAAGGEIAGMVLVLDLAAKKIVFEEKAPMHVHCFVLNEAGDEMVGVGHNKIAVWRME